MTADKIYDYIIIGGGLSGLLFANYLGASSKRCLLLEEKNNFGGAISSVKLGDLSIDSGAESFSLSSNATLGLIKNLNLDSQIVYPEDQPAYLKFESQLVQIPKGLLGIPADLSSADLLDLFTSSEILEAKQLDSQTWNLPKSISLGELVEKRFGPVFVKKLLNPVIMGVYANSPYNLEANSVLPGIVSKSEELNSLEAAIGAIRSKNIRPGANVASIKGGLYKIVEALVQNINQSSIEILTEKKVFKVSQDIDHWKINNTDGTENKSKNVIVCCPSIIAKKFFSTEKIVNSLNQFEFQDVITVLVLLECKKLNIFPLGTGALKVDVPKGSAKATTHVSAKWNWLNALLPKNQHLVRFSYGNQEQVGPESISEEMLSADFQSFYNLDAADFNIIDFKQVRWVNGLAQLGTGHSEKVTGLEKLESEFPGLFFAGSSISGSGITALVNKFNLQVSKMLV